MIGVVLTKLGARASQRDPPREFEMLLGEHRLLDEAVKEGS
jgi:hypothetical protein